MKRFLVIITVLCLVSAVALVGCGPKKVETSQEAIKTAQAMQTTEKQEKYLMAQAQLFFKEKNFQETINLTQYVLWNLDPASQEAKNLIRTSKDAMLVQAQMAASKK